MKVSPVVGSMIRQLRRADDLSQGQLAELADIEEHQVRRLESEYRTLDAQLEIAVRCAIAVRYDPRDLVAAFMRRRGIEDAASYE